MEAAAEFAAVVEMVATAPEEDVEDAVAKERREAVFG